jgi:hypothetical protein
MTVLLLAGLLLGPPLEVPTEPAAAPEFDEPIVIEAAPLPVSPTEPPKPIEAPGLVEPLEFPGGPTTIALPPPPPPPDGSGRLVGGALTIGLGIGAFIAVSTELRRPAGNPTYVASTFVPIGLAGLGIGTYLLVRGGKARANFRHWKQYTGYDAAPTGNGLLVGGTMITAVGAVVLMTGILRSSRGERDLQTTALLSIGGAAVVAGGAQLALGLVLRERHRRWRRNSLFVLRPPWIAPIAAGGLAAGVMGQF